MAEQPMSHLVPWVSLGGSIFSTVCTGYFWLVKTNRERPRLQPFLIDHEYFLAECRGEVRTIGLNLHLAVANYSILPNALLGLDVQIKSRDGSWKDLAKVTLDKQTPLPMNLPPLQTALVRIAARIPFEYRAELESQKNIERAYLDCFLATPITMKLSVRGLNQKQVSTVVHAKSERVAATTIKLAA